MGGKDALAGVDEDKMKPNEALLFGILIGVILLVVEAYDIKPDFAGISHDMLRVLVTLGLFFIPIYIAGWLDNNYHWVDKVIKPAVPNKKTGIVEYSEKNILVGLFLMFVPGIMALILFGPYISLL